MAKTTKKPIKTPVCKLKPVRNIVVVRERIAIKEVKGILMPEMINADSQSQMTEGEIIAIGPDAFKSPIWGGNEFPVGTFVKFNKYAGDAVVYNKKHYRMLSDFEITGTMDHYLQLEEDLIDG